MGLTLSHKRSCFAANLLSRSKCAITFLNMSPRRIVTCTVPCPYAHIYAHAYQCYMDYAIYIYIYAHAQRIGRGWPARACGAAFNLAREFTGTWCSMLVVKFHEELSGNNR